MPKIGNKVVNYALYVRENGKANKIGDTTSIQLPSIEFLSDTIKGAGILGEIDFPAYFQPGSMSLEASIRVSGEDVALIASAKDIELRWVTDVFDTNNVKTGINAHKAFIKCIPKKFDEGKLEPGASQEGSFGWEVFAYKRTINGKEVINIDKFNNIFALNGQNMMSDIQAAL